MICIPNVQFLFFFFFLLCVSAQFYYLPEATNNSSLPHTYIDVSVSFKRVVTCSYPLSIFPHVQDREHRLLVTLRMECKAVQGVTQVKGKKIL